MHVSPEGADEIRRHEGVRLASYQDGGGVWTIGYGHTGADVHAGQVITEDEAEDMFRRDLGVRELAVRVELTAPYSQNQLDALVSLVYNIGLEAFRTSHLLQAFNARRPREVARQWARWNKIGGHYDEGLAMRRAEEFYWYMGGR